MAYVRPDASAMPPAGRRVLYEVEMMAGLVERLGRFSHLLATDLPDDELSHELLDVAGRNADIEAFAVHARLVWCFLFGPHDRADDIVARDFFDSDADWVAAGLSEPAEVFDVRDRVNRSLAHLTYRGTEELGDQWVTTEIWEAFATVLGTFFVAASENRLDDETRDEALTILVETSAWRPPDAAAVPGTWSGLPQWPRPEAPPVQSGTALSQSPWRDPFE